MSAPEEDRERIECPICHQTRSHPVFRGASGPASAHPLVQCADCALVFQEYAPSDEEVDDAQADAYGAPQQRFNSVVEAAIRLFRMARVRMADRLLPPRGRVLDVGCGRGLFLKLLAERGFEVQGVEFSQRTAANADPTVPVDVGELRPGRYAEASFDLVSIWHVLEHERRPDQTLRAAFEALVPGGALLLAVPNFASWQARLGRDQWFHLDLPRHVFQFTPPTLHRIVMDAGFEVERSRTGQLEMDPFGLLQTALNRLGSRHNALYDTLRNNAAVRRDLSRARRLGLLAILPPGMLVALPSSLVLRALGRAGTLIVVARKPDAP